MNFVSSTDERFYHKEDESESKYAIEDSRPPSEFQYISICGQSIKQQGDLLFSNLLAASLPNCTAIAADLLCSFRFEEKLWPTLLDFFLRHINTENAFLPCKLLLELWTVFQTVKQECKYSPGMVRNHRALRYLLAQTLFVLAKSPSKPKSSGFQFTKGLFRGLNEPAASGASASSTGTVVESLCLSEKERKKRKRDEERRLAASLQKGQSKLVDQSNKSTFYLQLVSQNLRAPSTVFVDSLLSSLDQPPPTEENETYLSPFSLFLNEFVYSLSATDTRQTLFLQYWFHCLMELHAKKVSKNVLYKHKIKKNEDFAPIFRQIFRFMGPLKPSLEFHKEPSDAHVVWVVWCAILQQLEIKIAQRRQAAQPHDRIEKTMQTIRYLLVLYYIQFPTPASCTYLYMSVVFELFARQEEERYPLPANLAEFCAVFRETLPSFVVMSLSPFEIVNRCINRLDK